MTKQAAEPKIIKKTKRAHANGSVAAKQVSKQSKSSAPIFFDKTVVRIMKKHAPAGTRVTPGAIRLMRSILERRAMEFARKSYIVSRTLRGEDSVVRAMDTDAELVLKLMGGM